MQLLCCRSAFYNDVLLFDSKTRKLTTVATFPKDMPPRAMHSATLVGNRIWFIGGSDRGNIFGDVFTLNVLTWQWQKVAVK